MKPLLLKLLTNDFTAGKPLRDSFNLLRIAGVNHDRTDFPWEKESQDKASGCSRQNGVGVGFSLNVDFVSGLSLTITPLSLSSLSRHRQPCSERR